MKADAVISYLKENAELDRISDLRMQLGMPLKTRFSPLRNEILSSAAAGFLVCLIIMTNAGWSKSFVLITSVVVAAFCTVAYVYFFAPDAFGMQAKTELADLTELASDEDLDILRNACTRLTDETHLAILEAIGSPATRFRVLFAAEELSHDED